MLSRGVHAWDEIIDRASQFTWVSFQHASFTILRHYDQPDYDMIREILNQAAESSQTIPADYYHSVPPGESLILPVSPAAKLVRTPSAHDTTTPGTGADPTLSRVASFSLPPPEPEPEEDPLVTCCILVVLECIGGGLERCLQAMA